MQPGEVLADPALEARARALSAELRCMVCQNQSIDDSDADLAHDLRVLVRERLSAGDSDEQVIDYVVVALRRVRAAEAALQPAQRAAVAAPALLLVAGGTFICSGQPAGARGRDAAALTDEEKRGAGGDPAARTEQVAAADTAATLRKFHPAEMAP